MKVRLRARHSDLRHPPAWLLLLAVLCLPLTALAAQSPTAWFARMQRALEKTSYQGNIVYMRNGQPVAYRLVASADGFARLSALSGPPREVLRGPHVAVRLLGGATSMVVHDPRKGAAPLPFPPATQTPIKQLSRWYRFELGGWSRVAGQQARLVELLPRDEWRYGYRVWIAGASDLPLRAQMVAANGDVLEQAFFTQVRLIDSGRAHELIGSKAMTLAAHAASAPAPAAAKACPGKGDRGAVRLQQTPPGFEILRRECEPAPGGGLGVTHIVLGDGLNSVSVFVAPHRTGGTTFTGETGMGPVHAMGRMASGFAVTVMGSVPRSTIARIAGGIRIEGQ